MAKPLLGRRTENDIRQMRPPFGTDENETGLFSSGDLDETFKGDAGSDHDSMVFGQRVPLIDHRFQIIRALFFLRLSM